MSDNEWISVEERMPKGEKACLVTGEGRRAVAWAVAWVDWGRDAEWMRRGNDGWPEPIPFKVTHWSPLPDAPPKASAQR